MSGVVGHASQCVIRSRKSLEFSIQLRTDSPKLDLVIGEYKDESGWPARDKRTAETGAVPSPRPCGFLPVHTTGNRRFPDPCAPTTGPLDLCHYPQSGTRLPIFFIAHSNKILHACATERGHRCIHCSTLNWTVTATGFPDRDDAGFPQRRARQRMMPWVIRSSA